MDDATDFNGQAQGAQCVISIEGNLDTKLFNLALQEVVSRHFCR